MSSETFRSVNPEDRMPIPAPHPAGEVEPRVAVDTGDAESIATANTRVLTDWLEALPPQVWDRLEA